MILCAGSKSQYAPHHRPPTPSEVGEVGSTLTAAALLFVYPPSPYVAVKSEDLVVVARGCLSCALWL